MTSNTVRKRTANRLYKVRGTLVGADLVHHTIVLQPSEHDGKRIRRLLVKPDSEILAGDEPKTLADLIVGEWVTAHFVKEDEREVLKRLHIPRGMVSHPPIQSEDNSPSTPAARDPLPEAS